MKFMETRITEIVSPKMYFNNNDYIDDGGVDDPDKDVGFGEEGLEEEPGAGDVPNPDEDDKGSMME